MLKIMGRREGKIILCSEKVGMQSFLCFFCYEHKGYLLSVIQNMEKDSHLVPSGTEQNPIVLGRYEEKDVDEVHQEAYTVREEVKSIQWKKYHFPKRVKRFFRRRVRDRIKEEAGEEYFNTHSGNIDNIVRTLWKNSRFNIVEEHHDLDCGICGAIHLDLEA